MFSQPLSGSHMVCLAVCPQTPEHSVCGGSTCACQKPVLQLVIAKTLLIMGVSDVMLRTSREESNIEQSAKGGGAIAEGPTVGSHRDQYFIEV